MKTFLISPVRGADQEANERTVRSLERAGYIVHYPARDTNQNDENGLEICEENLRAIKEADVAHFSWDGESQGCLFDLGMAFALGKEVIPLNLPEPTKEKSFQNMVRAYARSDI